MQIIWDSTRDLFLWPPEAEWLFSNMRTRNSVLVAFSSAAKTDILILDGTGISFAVKTGRIGQPMPEG